MHMYLLWYANQQTAMTVNIVTALIDIEWYGRPCIPHVNKLKISGNSFIHLYSHKSLKVTFEVQQIQGQKWDNNYSKLIITQIGLFN